MPEPAATRKSLPCNVESAVPGPCSRTVLPSLPRAGHTHGALPKAAIDSVHGTHHPAADPGETHAYLPNAVFLHAAPATHNILTRFRTAKCPLTSEILGTLCATRRRARQFIATPRPLPESPQCTPPHRLQPPRCSRPTARPRTPCLPAQSPAISATKPGVP